MKERIFRPGDLIRIRQWDDMEQEFGMNDYGSIACKFTFVPEMKDLCGMTAIIAEIEDDEVFFEPDSCDNSDYKSYRFSTHMIEYVGDGTAPEISPDALNKILTAR